MKVLKKGRKNNIVFAGRFIESETLSGPEKFSKRIFENIGEWLPAETVTFIQYFFDGRMYSRKQKLFGFQQTEYNGSKVYTAGLFRTYMLLKKLKPAIIHITAFERFSVIAILYRLLSRSKIVYTCNGIVRYENSKLKKVSFLYRIKDSICERMLFRFSDTIVFPSSIAYDLSKEYYNNVDKKGAVIPNGIDTIFERTLSKPAKTNETGNALKAVFIYKNELNDSGLSFLKEFLAASRDMLILYIITPAALKFNDGFTEVRLIKPMNTSRLAEFYLDKDIFFSLNEYDTFSISTIEAMASGVIPIVTNQTGMSSFIKNGANGFTVEFGDTKALTSIISKLVLMESKKRLDFKQNAAAIYKKWNWHTASGAYLHEYRQLAGDLND